MTTKKITAKTSTKKTPTNEKTTEEKVVAKDKEHLKKLIKAAIKKNGINCDLNFIDVSQSTEMNDLFW